MDLLLVVIPVKSSPTVLLTYPFFFYHRVFLKHSVFFYHRVFLKHFDQIVCMLVACVFNSKTIHY